jgi:RHS repeat-associated protein
MPMKVRYTVLDGELLSENRTGTERDYVPDPAGSTVALLDSTQGQTDTFSYWPYGEDRDRAGTTALSFRFIGTRGYYRDAADRSYLRARHYAGGRGSFFTRAAPSQRSSGEQPYTYANANPTSFIDPDGKRPIRRPQYFPDLWNRPGFLENNNCWSYACNTPFNSRPTDWPASEPDYKPEPGGAGCGGNNCTCRALIDCVEKSGAGLKPRRGRCPNGTYTVILFIRPKPPCGFHFIRLDSNGLWSEKCGGLRVGPQFDNPYQRAIDNGYNVVCQHFCATK